MSSTTIAIRPIQNSDIPLIINYWLNSDPDHLVGMGVDLERLPTASALRHMLETQINTPIKLKPSFALIWLVDEHPIGHSNINDITYGHTATVHLHIWEKQYRQKGLGHQLMIQSLDIFFKEFALNEIKCEPYALNPSPNKTLEKIGFKFRKQYRTIPGSLNFEQNVNQWYILRGDFLSLYPNL